MPINSLVRKTGDNIPTGGNFPKLGKLFKGGKKRKNASGKDIFGLDLKHFRFESQDEDAMHMFETAYGKEPTVIDVMLVHSTPDEAFQFWMEEYRGHTLMHRCDGETCVLHRLPNGQISNDPIPCPGNCSRVGRMSVILPKLMRFASVTVETHSKLDILQLQDNLWAAFQKLGDLTRIPFTLSRRDRDVTYVEPGGTQAKTVKKSLLFLEVHPEVMKTHLLSLANDRLLSAGLAPNRMLTDNLIVDALTGEVIEDDEENEGDFVAGETLERSLNIKETIDNLYGDTLDENSQYQFTRWLLGAFTKKETPKNIRDKEGQLTAAEVKRIINNLNDPEKKKTYLAAYLKRVAENIQAEANAKEKAEADERARVEADSPVVEGEATVIKPPESELIAA